MNLVFHTANALLIFLLARRIWPESGLWPWGAWWVAAVWALHPVQVESVAWVAERKNVLSTCFWLLGVWAYLRFVERPGLWRYGWVAICLAGGLLAKPMVVTFPMTLLLLDWWPLRRWPSRSWSALAWEKAPLFLLAGASSIVTLLVQRGHRAMEYGGELSLAGRVANALVSYIRYVKAVLWPDLLLPYYPHPGQWPWWVVLGAGLLLVAGTWLAFRARERLPGALFGWLWFLITMLPVIGLVQVGSQAMADRYLYVPMLGLLAMLVAAADAVCKRWRRVGRVAAAVGVLVLAACMVRTRAQLPIWRDGVALAEYLYSQMHERAAAYQMLAQAYASAGKPDSQIAVVYREAIGRFPGDPVILAAMGTQAIVGGQADEGLAALRRAMEIRPQDATVRATLGNALLMAGRFAEAEAQFRQIPATSPMKATKEFRLAQIDNLRGRWPEAAQGYGRAIDWNAWDWAAWAELGGVSVELGRFSDAVRAYERALWINPGDTSTRQKLETLRRRMGG